VSPKQRPRATKPRSTQREGDLLTVPVVTYRGSVKASECDHWGHLGTQYYLAKADDAQAALCCELGLAPSWLRSRNAAMVLRRNRVMFKRELRAGDAVHVRSGVREAQEATLRFCSVLYGELNTQSAVFESEARLVDRTTGIPIDLPTQAIERGVELAVSDVTFPMPQPLGNPRPPARTPPQAMLTQRGALGAWGRDDTGLAPPHFMIPRFSAAMTGLMAHLGLSRPVLLSRHLGYAALDCGFEHPALLRPGQSVDIRSGVLEVRRKALRIFHQVLDTTSGDVVAAMEVVLVFFDLRARKSVVMPEEILARAGEFTPG